MSHYFTFQAQLARFYIFMQQPIHTNMQWLWGILDIYIYLEKSMNNYENYLRHLLWTPQIVNNIRGVIEFVVIHG